MLARNTHKKITARQADGLNRREEIELTQFDKPVLDIERTSRRKNGTYGAPDISEDHQVNANKYNEVDQFRSDIRLGLNDSLEESQGLTSNAPYVYSNDPISASGKANEETWSEAYWSF